MADNHNFKFEQLDLSLAQLSPSLLFCFSHDCTWRITMHIQIFRYKIYNIRKKSSKILVKRRKESFIFSDFFIDSVRHVKSISKDFFWHCVFCNENLNLHCNTSCKISAKTKWEQISYNEQSFQYKILTS